MIDVYEEVSMSKTNNLRREKIEILLFERNRVQVKELAQILEVSPETIRCDLRFLEGKGVLYRTQGGATLRGTNIDIPMEIRHQEKVFEKRRIAKKALDYIRDDDIIYIDPSSTALYLGTLLKTKKNLTIITNSLKLVPILENGNHKIIVTGGEYSCQGKRLVGDYTLKIIDTIYFDVCIMGMDGCLGIDGPANMIPDEVILNDHLLQRSRKSILGSDSSKFSKCAHFQYAKFSMFDILITDKLSTNDRKRCNVKEIVEVGQE